jgi:3-hydroxyisobutyrate dehydrogenase
VENVGFVGLGNMGGVLAANLVERGFAVVAFDAAGADRVPDGARPAAGLADLARRAELVVLSLPDGAASAAVCAGLVEAGGAVRTVVDTSTVGVAAAESIAATLAEAGIGYLDAPVSGGPAGARARTLTVMYAGPTAVCASAGPVLAGLSDRTRRVGDRAGLGQALKLANNFLSATALAATSEAVAFGTSVGLDMATMLEVLAEASGRSAAVDDKFPRHVLTGRYASGFANTLMAKDLRLYRDAVARRRTPAEHGETTLATWERFAAAEPGADFTRIYPFTKDAP